jgi:predicted metalloprotease
MSATGDVRDGARGRWRGTAAVAVLAAAVLTAGCVIGQAGDDGSAPGGPPAADGPRDRPGQAASGESLEGRFTHETMGEYVDAVTPMITQWMEDTWASMPLPARVVYVPRGTAGAEDCLDPSGSVAQYTSMSYEYCGVDQTIYVGQDMLWEFYTRTGDAGPAVGLAHEFGHHIQQQAGVRLPRTADDSVRHEDQADCLAGAWTRYTDEQGWLEYPDDIEDIEALFPLIGSAEGQERDHGTVTERARSFQRGFGGGVPACNAFTPDAPLIAE